MNKMMSVIPTFNMTKSDCVQVKANLINSLYYDTEWWEKKWALEWWSKNGHFNEELYRKVLVAKLDLVNEEQQI